MFWKINFLKLFSITIFNSNITLNKFQYISKGTMKYVDHNPFRVSSKMFEYG